MKYLLMLLFAASVAFANPDVVWQKEVATPTVVKFSPDDKYVAYHYLDRFFSDPNNNYVAVIDVETAGEVFRYYNVFSFDFYDKDRVMLNCLDSMNIVNFKTNEIENTIYYKTSVSNFDFNRELNKALFWIPFASKNKPHLLYFEHDFNSNETGELHNLDAIVTRDSMHYEYDYHARINFMRYTYDNNFIISIAYEIYYIGNYYYTYYHTYLFNPEENKYFVKNNIILQNTCRTALSENREFVASENFDNNNISLDIYSVKDSLKIVKSFPSDNVKYRLVNISHDDKYLLQAIDSGLIIWDLEDTEKPVHTYEIYNPTFNYGIIDISHDNKYIAIFNEHLLVLIKGYFNPSSVGEDKNDIKIQIVPNPAEDYIEISIDDDNPDYKIGTVMSNKIEIYDVLGNKVFNSTPSLLSNATPQEGNFKINVSQLPRGVYFVKIGDRVEKFVKM